MAFNPLSISGCTLWLKGDAGVFSDHGTTPAVNGNNLGSGQWNDQSGAGHNCVNVSNTLYVTGVAPSFLPVLDFNSAGGVSAGYVVGSPYTVFCVYLVEDTTGNHRAVQGSTNWLIGPRGGFHTHFAGGFVSGTGAGTTLAVTINLFVIGSATNSGSASTIQFNGVDFTAGGTNVGTPGTFDLCDTGAAAEPLANAGSYGYLAEVLVYNTVLSSTDRGHVTTYLQRWQNPPPPATANPAALLPAM